MVFNGFSFVFLWFFMFFLCFSWCVCVCVCFWYSFSHVFPTIVLYICPSGTADLQLLASSFGAASSRWLQELQRRKLAGRVRVRVECRVQGRTVGSSPSIPLSHLDHHLGPRT